MPRTMVHPQSVTVETAVCIADRGGSGVVYRCDPHTNKLTKLPQYQYCQFTVTELTHQLVVVGGLDMSTLKPTNTVAVYPTSQMSRKQPYPPMTTPRMLPAVSAYLQRLVAAGGRVGSWTDLATVEILDTPSSHCQLVAFCYRTSGEMLSDFSCYYTRYIVPTRMYTVQKSAQCVPLSPYAN